MVRWFYQCGFGSVALACGLTLAAYDGGRGRRNSTAAFNRFLTPIDARLSLSLMVDGGLNAS